MEHRQENTKIILAVWITALHDYLTLTRRSDRVPDDKPIRFFHSPASPFPSVRSTLTLFRYQLQDHTPKAKTSFQPM